MAIVIPPPPPPPEKAATKAPLGVPEGYTVPGPKTADVLGVSVRVPGTQMVQPRYRSGDEFTPARLPPDRIAAAQRALLSAGLIGPKTKFRVGVWDEPTRSAYKNLLEFANTYGYTEDQALEVYAQSPEVNASGITGADLPAVKLTHRDDVRGVADTVARAVLGRNVPADFVDKLVNAWHGVERADALAQTTATPDPSGSFAAYEGGPSLTEFVESKLRTEYATEAREQDELDMGAEFFKLLSETGAG